MLVLTTMSASTARSVLDQIDDDTLASVRPFTEAVIPTVRLKHGFPQKVGVVVRFVPCGMQLDGWSTVNGERMPEYVAGGIRAEVVGKIEGD